MKINTTAVVRGGAVLAAAGIVLPWVTADATTPSSASGFAVAAGAMVLWHQPELYVIPACAGIIVLLARFAPRHRALRAALTAISLLTVWICVRFALRPIPFGDSTPQALFPTGFAGYQLGAGSLVSLLGCLAMAAGLGLA